MHRRMRERKAVGLRMGPRRRAGATGADRGSARPARRGRAAGRRSRDASPRLSRGSGTARAARAARRARRSPHSARRSAPARPRAGDPEPPRGRTRRSANGRRRAAAAAGSRPCQEPNAYQLLRKLPRLWACRVTRRPVSWTMTPSAEEEVRDDVEVVAQRQVLVAAHGRRELALSPPAGVELDCSDLREEMRAGVARVERRTCAGRARASRRAVRAWPRGWPRRVASVASRRG